MSASEDADVLASLLGNLPTGVDGDARLVRSGHTTVRFANSRVRQPMHEEHRVISLRLAVGGRIATATSGATSPKGLHELVAEALSLARVAPVEARFPGFAGRPEQPLRATAFSRATSTLSPERASRLAHAALDAADADAPGSRVAGAIHVGGTHLSVATTAGLELASRWSSVVGSVLAERLDGEVPASGWAEGAHFDVARFDPARLGREAAQKVAATPPRPARPGRYRVVLSGSAVSELLGTLGYLGFGGHAEEQGWSCLAKRRGRRVVASNVSVTDDATSRHGIPVAIDFEGHPKRPTPLLVEGVAAGPVTDLLTAARLGSSPPGHALPPESPWGELGPVPTHPVMAAGDASWEELVRETRRGILVTRFHYVRVVHPGRSEITGMTRDGTYRIDGGEVTEPLTNLRFTQSILATLGATTLVGRVRRCFSDERGVFSATCPAIATTGFRFTSATVF